METTAFMMKTQFGLGVLSVPGILDVLGLNSGNWSNYVVGRFKLQHPDVYAIDDAGDLMFGRLGREFLGIGVCIYWIFCSGTGILSTSIGLNAVSSHGTCTAVFVAVAAMVVFIKWTAWAGLACVFVAVIMVTIAVAVQDRAPLAPQDGPWESDYKLIGGPTFTQQSRPLCFLTPGLLMRDPSVYARCILICQAGVIAVYITVCIVVYYYCGSYVASPGLGSAGILIKKIPYGISLPGLVASTIIILHFSSKYKSVRLLRGSRHSTANTFIHWATWLGCTLSVNVSAYLFASRIRIFGDLVSLIGLFSYTGYCFGSFLIVAGAYGAIVNIIASSKAASGASACSCADNSNS
ncbi:hypothetical protein BDW60DRAFT_221056 [Aspergillus nidulans var. acristatus]